MMGLIALSGNEADSYTAEVATFGENLKRLRELATPKIQQEELARRLKHANNSTISKWENHGVLPKPETIIEVAKAIGVKPRELLEDVVTEYDKLRGSREGQSYTKNDVPNVTRSVREGEVQEDLRTGGPSDADAAVVDRVSESKAALDVEVRSVWQIERRFALAKRLDRSLADLRSIADALRADPHPGASGTKRAAGARGRETVRGRAARRSSR